MLCDRPAQRYRQHMEWHHPISLPVPAVTDPRLRPGHLALLIALRGLWHANADLDFRASNYDVMQLAHLRDSESMYTYRDDLRGWGMVHFAQGDGVCRATRLHAC